MAFNANGTCQAASTRVTCTRIAAGHYQARYPQAVFGATGPWPVIEAGSAAILNATTSFDNATSEWVIDYTFTDGADHIHIIHAATGY